VSGSVLRKAVEGGVNELSIHPLFENFVAYAGGIGQLARGWKADITGRPSRAKTGNDARLLLYIY
jgi:hypothetical protein